MPIKLEQGCMTIAYEDNAAEAEATLHLLPKTSRN